MKNKLALWQKKAGSWDEQSLIHKKQCSLKELSFLPSMIGITPRTAKLLRWKALWYLVWHDSHKIFSTYFFRRPIAYACRLLRSYCKRKSFTREGDLFFYQISSSTEFVQKARSPQAIVLVGFSYCHKPFECPSGRFTDACQNMQDNPICGQCFIGKVSHLLQDTSAHIVYIPTIHYIGQKLLQLQEQYKDHKILFLITACELSLTMFADWGHMIEAEGIGIRLSGRICNTMKAFSLSEKGIKPGLTILPPSTQEQMLHLLQQVYTDAYDGKV